MSETVNGKTGKRKHPTYDDQFRASAVCMLQSQGYPENAGALSIVARHLKLPGRTLRRWFNGENNPPPDNLVQRKKEDLKTLFINEIYEILKVLPDHREDATYQQLTTSLAIFFDKVRLLEGLPTEVIRVTVELDALAKRKGLSTTDAIIALRDRMDELPDVQMLTEGSGAN
ncbi:MAG TPA: hypothetical protein VJ325_02135 [Thiobacillus sp.]|nr:hypothetical protein [Thiobacillus sp.]